MALDTEQPPHAFPSWPMSCLTYYRHLADDYARCVGALGKTIDPVQAARAEGDYGVSVMHDMIQAWYDLALAPFTAMTKAARAAPPVAPEEERTAKTA